MHIKEAIKQDSPINPFQLQGMNYFLNQKTTTKVQKAAFVVLAAIAAVFDIVKAIVVSPIFLAKFGYDNAVELLKKNKPVAAPVAIELPPVVEAPKSGEVTLIAVDAPLAPAGESLKFFEEEVLDEEEAPLAPRPLLDAGDAVSESSETTESPEAEAVKEEAAPLSLRQRIGTAWGLRHIGAARNWLWNQVPQFRRVGA